MNFLSSNVDYTTPELAEKLDTTERTVYRYILSLKESEFILVKKNRNTYKLIEMPIDEIKFKSLVMISSEEAFILHSLMLAITGDSQMLHNLERKLAALFDATSITEIIGNKTVAENVRTLKRAIERMECVELVDYESGNTMKVSNRIVEPYAFSTNYNDIYAYELSSGLNKTFKISRIGWVKPLGKEWENEAKHEAIDPDCFRMNGKESIKVNLKMTLKAKNLLVEEYPLSSQYLTYNNESWMLRTTVKDMSGVCRFYLGLSDQIQIVDSPELEEHIRKHIHSNLVKYI